MRQPFRSWSSPPPCPGGFANHREPQYDECPPHTQFIPFDGGSTAYSVHLVVYELASNNHIHAWAVYAESNGAAGVQRYDFHCRDPGGYAYDADTVIMSSQDWDDDIHHFYRCCTSTTSVPDVQACLTAFMNRVAPVPPALVKGTFLRFLR